MPETGEGTGSSPVGAYCLHPGEGAPGWDAAVKASRQSTGGVLTLIESHTTGGAPLHVHTREDEFLYVLEGAITVLCGEEEWEAGPGSFISLPRGIPHAWDVVGARASVLMFTVPAMLEEFLREFHAATGAERAEVAARYGIAFLPAREPQPGKA